MSGYIGNIPVPQATQTRQSFTATASQTTFNTAGYSPGYIDVFLNGVKLAPADYTATNGSDVVLAVGAASGDILETVAYEIFQVLDQDFTGDFTVDGTTFVVDSTNDRVGIGTSSPSDKLHVNGNGKFNNIAFGGYLSPYGDDTYINMLGSGRIQFRTNGSEAMRIDSSGNVGIGTSSPDTKFHVSGGNARIAGTETSGSFIDINASNTGSDGATLGVSYYGSGSYGPLKFSTGGSERMRIDSSGKVLIGHTSSVQSGSGNSFDVNANLQTVKVSTSSDQQGFISSTLYASSSSGRRPIQSFQRSRSGTAGSYGLISGGDYLGTVHFNGDDGTGFVTGATIEAVTEGTPAADNMPAYLAFKTNGGSTDATERMRIDSSGRVGIGTSSPSQKLHVEGAGNQFILLNNSTTSDGFYIKAGTGAASFQTAGGSHVMNFFTSGSERMRIASTGELLVGTTSDTMPAAAAAGQGIMAGTRAFIATEASGDTILGGTTGSNFTAFYQGGTERMRIDSSGAVAIGDSNPTRHGQTTKTLIYNGSGTTGDFALHVGRVGTGTENQVCFSNGYGKVGSITTSGTSTAYNTSSDYRLKENITDVTDGITRVKQLAPKRFNFIADPDTTVDGFIAHEVQDVIPEAISGAKDAMRDEEYEVTPAVEATFDEEGNVLTEAVDAVMGTRSVPDYQGIDQAKLVPLLTAALQEAIAKIETLETEMTSVKARLDALEAN